MTLPTVTIRQLESPSKTLELGQPCAPRESFALPISQRGTVQRYPGIRAGLARLDGGLDEPTELTCLWDTVQMSRSSAACYFSDSTGKRQIKVAEELVEIVREMAADSVLVAVSLGRFEPVGFLRLFEPERLARHLDRWSVTLEFEWTAPGEGAQKGAGFGVAKRDFGDVMASVRAKMNGILGKAEKPASMGKARSRQIDGAVTSLGLSVGSAEDVAAEYKSSTSQQQGLPSAAGQSLSGISAACRDLEAAVDDPPAALAQTGDPGAIIFALGYGADMARAAADMRRESTLARRRLAPLARTNSRGVVIGMAGQDLRLIGWRYYGTTEAWRDIAAFNGLPGSQLTGGERIMLPIETGS
jgi:hypothetical protein